MEELQKKIKPLLATKDIQLDFLLRDYPDMIHCDSSLLERAVLNVISNAVDFTPKEATIRVEAYELDGCFNIEITDSGIGFSEKDLEQSKQRFYMGDSSRSSRNHYGMGLTITDNIVAQHKGELILRNGTADLSGAQVIISIPV
jgi:Osmosensitive K+ channel histidine kinase